MGAVKDSIELMHGILTNMGYEVYGESKSAKNARIIGYSKDGVYDKVYLKIYGHLYLGTYFNTDFREYQNKENILNLVVSGRAKVDKNYILSFLANGM